MRTAMFSTGASAPAGMVAHQSQALPHERSPWHTPVPYLFGGLAAILGLIAFALLLLACSYWKLSGYLESGNGVRGDGDAGDLEGGEGKPGNAGGCKLPPLPPEQRIVVIMAGDDKPTFLATPMSSRASSFGDNAGKGGGEGESKAEGEKADAEAEPRNDTVSHEHREEDTHENPGEAETRRRQNQDQLQAVEETHQSLGRNQ
ncbi:hypothetical protein Taro_029190 [Colocasia esculenta]|uniref:GDU1 n=1 Tax=Colocasia esculenta TaxID=4460 RepID=A0A843VJ85_COLES|nr:hypothetical protein [Colocasia esculenta]